MYIYLYVYVYIEKTNIYIYMYMYISVLSYFVVYCRRSHCIILRYPALSYVGLKLYKFPEAWALARAHMDETYLKADRHTSTIHRFIRRTLKRDLFWEICCIRVWNKGNSWTLVYQI